MPIDPASLEAISNPTGGRLSAIGQIISKNRQQRIDNEREEAALIAKADELTYTKEQDKIKNDRNAVNDEIAKNKTELEMMNIATQTAGAYASNMIKWKAEHPNATTTEFYAEQTRAIDDIPEAARKFVNGKPQTLATLVQQKINNEEYQNWYNKDKDKTGVQSGGSIFDKGGEYIGSGYRDSKGNIKFDSGESWDGRKYDYVSGGVSAESTEGVRPSPAAKSSAKIDEVFGISIVELSSYAGQAKQNNNMLKQIVSDPLFTQGTFTEFMAKFSNAATSFGFEGAQNMNDVYIAIGKGNDEVLAKMFQIKGNASIPEVDIVLDSSYAVSNPLEAGKIKVFAASELINEAEERHVAMDNWRLSHKDKLTGFKESWMKDNQQRIKRTKDKFSNTKTVFYSDAKSKAIKHIESVTSTLPDNDATTKIKRDAMEKFELDWKKL